jgi:hypothetical protein
VASILQPSAEASSSSSSAASPGCDSTDDGAPNGDLSHNSFSRYSTIGGLEASDAQTPNLGMVQNLNLNFNTMWFQTIMESIQCMVPEGSPLIALMQEGVEAANLVIAERLADNPRREPFVRN